MLSAIVVTKYAPLGGLSGYTEGVCVEGADFLCGVRNGVYSCRPCNVDQLSMFKDLQIHVNSILESRGLAARIERGPKARSAIDGRIGSSTTVALGELAEVVADEFPPQAVVREALEVVWAAPASQDAARAVARTAPEITAWLVQVASGLQASISPDTAPPRKRSRAPLFVGVVAGLAAIGLVGTAIYQRRG